MMRRRLAVWVAVLVTSGVPAAAGAATPHLTPSERHRLQQGLQNAQRQRALGQGVSPSSGPGGANGAGPISPGLPQGAAPTATTTTPSAPVVANPATSGSSPGSGLSGGSAVAIGIGALVVLGGISFFIWRDARKRAPVRAHAATATAGAGGGRSGSKKARAKQQRKLSPAERRRRKRGRAR